MWLAQFTRLGNWEIICHLWTNPNTCLAGTCETVVNLKSLSCVSLFARFPRSCHYSGMVHLPNARVHLFNATGSHLHPRKGSLVNTHFGRNSWLAVWSGHQRAWEQTLILESPDKMKPTKPTKKRAFLFTEQRSIHLSVFFLWPTQ